VNVGASSAVRNHIRLKLESALTSVELVETTAEEFALRAGFDEDTSSHIAMVAREAAINAVKHGNQWSAEKQVEVGFELTATALTIRVADEGAGLNMENVKDCCEPENLLRTSGRGIFLMNAIMDEVHFRKLTPGTEITMVKCRTEKETEA
jgi:serine/threonine-protein kinase RsbW